MKSVVLVEPNRLEQQETEMPSRQADRVLVRVRRIGICGTDLHAFEGRQPYFSYPRILGHEIAAEIVEIGANRNGLHNGDLCVVLPYLSDGTCIACRQGKTNCCVNLRVLGVHVDGGMQEYISVPLANLVPAPDLTLEQMALVENQSIGAHAVRRAQLEPDEWVLVIGAGPIGIGVMQFARVAGANVIVLDVSAKRLDFCRRDLGVEHIINGKDNPLAQIEELTHGDFPTAVFDATGSANAMMGAFDFVAHGGRIVFVSIVQSDITFSDPNFHKRETTLMGSRNATREDFEHVIQSIAAGKIVTDPLTTHRVSFDQVAGEFSRWLDPEAGVIKAMVEI